MWPRHFEIALACWLAVAPFVFVYGAEARLHWANDFTCAALMAVFALACYARPLEKLHLLNIAIGVWLAGLGWFIRHDPPAAGAADHYVALGLLVILLGILPSHANAPPRAWQQVQQ